MAFLGWDFSPTEKANIEAGTSMALGSEPLSDGLDSTYMMCCFLAGKELPENATVPFQAVTQANIETDEVKAYMATMGM